MKRVIERCPNCGVEHDDPRGGPCEVCGTPLRFWCRVHSRETGWLDSAACPACAAERSRPAPPPRAPQPPPPRRPAPRREEPVEAPFEEPVVIIRSGWPPRRVPRPWGGRDAGGALREGAEELAPYAAAGATFAVRLMLALFAVARSAIVWGVLGAVGGFLYASSAGGRLDVLWTAAFGAMAGGMAGLFFGAIRALRILFAQPRRPDG